MSFRVTVICEAQLRPHGSVLEFGKAKCGMHHGADLQEWATLGLKLNSLGFSLV
jgi:hypothetical protein